MLTVHPEYLTDNEGNKVSVVLPINEFKKLMDEIEELENIRLYDESKVANEPSVPLDEAFNMIEANRKNHNESGL
jgi:hypothetical protein